MKKTLFILVSLLATQLTVAQNPANSDLQDNFGINLGLINVGINYEKAFGETFSVNSIFEYSGGFYSRLGGDLEYVIASSLSVEPRYYYNRNRRQNKGKNIDFNVGNFFAGDLSYAPIFGSISSNDNVEVLDSFVAGIKYGLRRKVVQKLNFEFAFGAGALFSELDTDILPILDLKLQYVIF